MSTSAPLILSASLSPNPVVAGGTFTISIQIEECTHERLEGYTHAQLASYTHEELATEILDQ